MRVLLAQDYAHLRGGAELITADLRDGLRARGHDVRLLATRAGGAGSADVLTFGTTGRLRGLLQAANPVAVGDLRRELRGFSPDVVHVGMFLTQLSPLILPVLRGLPAVWSAQWSRAVCASGTRLLPSGEVCSYRAGLACLTHGCIPRQDWPPIMVQLALARRWQGAFDAITACSESLAAELRAGGFGSVQVVRNGVPVRARRPPLRAPASLAFMGRLVPGKGTAVLLRAFATLAAGFPDVRLLVIGDGPERGRLMALATSLGVSDRVEFAGWLSRTDAELRLGDAWIQVVPSIYSEAFGLVAAEAMMRGTAVVASGIGGLAETIQDGVDGRLVPSNDAPALAAALARLLADREAAEELGARGRETAVDRFTSDRFVSEMEAILEAVAGQVRPVG